MIKLLRFFLGCILVAATDASFAHDKNAFQDSSFHFQSNLPPDQLNPLDQPHGFLFNTSRQFNFNIPDSTYCYIVIKVQNHLPFSYRLCVNNTSLDEVHIYRFYTSSPKQLLYTGGNLIPYDTNRDYVWHTAPLAAGQMPSYYLIAIKGVSQNVNLNYEIMPSGELKSLYRSLDRFVYFYVGFVLLISLISVIGGLLFKRKALLIYAGYVITLASWILAHYGYLYATLYPSFPALNRIIKPVSSLMSLFCMLTLITASFNAELNRSWMRKTFLALKTVTTLLIIIYLLHLTNWFGFYDLIHINIFWNFYILFSISFIIIVLFTFLKTNRTALLFAIAISLVSVTAMLQMFSNIGWLYNYFLSEHGITIASLLEILLLAFGTFYNLWKEKADRERELKIAENERTKTLQMLIGVQDEERKRIAGDLHDSIGPMLAAIKINFLRTVKAKTENVSLDALVAKTEDIIDESIAEIRAISHRLMPKGLSSKGLITLLSDYFTDLEAVHGLHISFTHQINVALEKEMQLNLYRMISELSLNAARHSGAKTLSVLLETLPEETLVVISDDGKGFTKEAKGCSSLGIKNVRSRVNYLKGSLRLDSLPGKGTTIEIRIPNTQDL